jgi:hypothetical protein
MYWSLDTVESGGFEEEGFFCSGALWPYTTLAQPILFLVLRSCLKDRSSRRGGLEDNLSSILATAK